MNCKRVGNRDLGRERGRLPVMPRSAEMMSGPRATCRGLCFVAGYVASLACAGVLATASHAADNPDVAVKTVAAEPATRPMATDLAVLSSGETGLSPRQRATPGTGPDRS